MFCVLPGNPKRISSRRGLNEVNRWLLNEKKNELWIFLVEIDLKDRLFSVEICFCYSFFYCKICISKFLSGFTNRKHPEISAFFPILHQYSRLFWTLEQNDFFIQPTTLRLFNYLIKAILGSKFLQNWFTDVSTFWEIFSPTITLEIVKRK